MIEIYSMGVILDYLPLNLNPESPKHSVHEKHTDSKPSDITSSILGMNRTDMY